jgi:hypothetical protein
VFASRLLIYIYEVKVSTVVVDNVFKANKVFTYTSSPIPTVVVIDDAVKFVCIESPTSAPVDTLFVLVAFAYTVVAVTVPEEI